MKFLDGIHKHQYCFGEVIFNEVILKDCYGIREYFKRSKTNIKTIVDIGANIGSFSLLVSMLYPEARRIAIEPSSSNFALLEENMIALNVECKKFALGDGSNKRLQHDERFSGSDYVYNDPNGPIISKTLSQIFEELKIETDGLIVKMDCEGGELSLTEQDMKYLSGVEYLICEVHEKKPEDLKHIENLFNSAFRNHKFDCKYLGQDLDNKLHIFKVEKEKSDAK